MLCWICAIDTKIKEGRFKARKDQREDGQYCLVNDEQYQRHQERNDSPFEDGPEVPQPHLAAVPGHVKVRTRRRREYRPS